MCDPEPRTQNPDDLVFLRTGLILLGDRKFQCGRAAEELLFLRACRARTFTRANTYVWTAANRVFLANRMHLLTVTFPLLALLVAASANLPDATTDGIPAVKTWAQQRVKEGEQSFARSGLKRTASPSNWNTKVVYQIQVDRFNNGNLSNDDLNVPPYQQQHQNRDNMGLPDYRHGGDIEGIIDRLDYLVDLRITAIWITPVLHHNGDYHGYCTTDMTEIDPGFGTTLGFRKLVSECHKRGISVIMDVVINHLCDRDTTYTKSPNHQQCPQDNSDLYWTGKAGQSPNRGNLSFSNRFFPPLKSSFFFNQCGPDSSQEMEGLDPAAVFGDFTAGMFDYDTRNYDFQDIFTNLLMFWVAYADVDGFRLDAAKHVTDDFLAYFSTTTREYATTLGKENFLVLGEVAASSAWEGRALGRMMTDPTNPDKRGIVPPALTTMIWQLKPTYSKNKVFPLPGLNSIYDFAESGTSRSALLESRPSSDVAKYYDSADFKTIVAQTLGMTQCTDSCFTLLEIHDWPRFLSANPNRGDLIVSGLAYLLTAPGVPIIYYGLEQGFNGNCPSTLHAGSANPSIAQTCQQSSGSDSLKRQDMFVSGPWRLNSAIQEIDSLSYVGPVKPALSPQWREDPMLNTNISVYQVARKLSALRGSCSALAGGAMVWKYASDSNGGVMVFSRVTDTEEMLIMVNPGGAGSATASTYPIDSKINTVSGQKYANVFDSSQIAFTGFDQNHQATLYLPKNFRVSGGSMAIFARVDNLLPVDKLLSIQLCKR